jgi:hypothetical protein
MSLISVCLDAGCVVTMDQQCLPITAFADPWGEIVPHEAARYCAAGPDAAGEQWLVDLRTQRRVRR